MLHILTRLLSKQEASFSCYISFVSLAGQRLGKNPEKLANETELSQFISFHYLKGWGFLFV